MTDTDDVVRCDGCNALARRRRGYEAPDFWFWLESKVDRPWRKDSRTIHIVYACSEACRDGLWKQGKGPGRIDEEGTARMREKTETSR